MGPRFKSAWFGNYDPLQVFRSQSQNPRKNVSAVVYNQKTGNFRTSGEKYALTDGQQQVYATISIGMTGKMSRRGIRLINGRTIITHPCRISPPTAFEINKSCTTPSAIPLYIDIYVEVLFIQPVL